MMNVVCDRYRLRSSKDECGDRVIVGRYGNVHEDGKGLSVWVRAPSSSGLDRRIAAIGGEVRQRGDDEAVIYVDDHRRMKAVIKACGLRPKRQLSETSLAKLKESGAAWRYKAGSEGNNAK